MFNVQMGSERITGSMFYDGDDDVPIPADKFMLEYLEDAGSVNMNVLGSAGTPVDFGYTVPVGVTAHIARCNIFMRDATPTPSEFGGIPALTNGLEVQVLDDQSQVVNDFHGARPITRNADFVAFAGIDVVYETGVGEDTVNIRWTLTRQSGGESLLLKEGETFRVRVRDDLTGITEFFWVLQGRYA
jgi:hypothetical protein